MIPAHRSVTVGRTPGRSIVDLTRDSTTAKRSFSVGGRRKPITGAVLGSTIDHVVENTPCDVVVAKTVGPVEPRSILVPTAVRTRRTRNNSPGRSPANTGRI